MKTIEIMKRKDIKNGFHLDQDELEEILRVHLYSQVEQLLTQKENTTGLISFLKNQLKCFFDIRIYSLIKSKLIQT